MPAAANDAVRITGSPAASEASRSTVATIAKSWLPSGSSTIWRTDQVRELSPAGCLSIMSSSGERACGPAPRDSCSSQYAPSASSHAGAVIAGRRGGSVSAAAAASSCASASKRSREARCTFWNIALRTMTVNARRLRVIGRGVVGASPAAIAAAARATDSGSVSASHSSSRLESVWRTVSPSHSTISSNSSVFTSSGTVWRSAR